MVMLYTINHIVHYVLNYEGFVFWFSAPGFQFLLEGGVIND